jgi:beta-galactosidase
MRKIRSTFVSACLASALAVSALSPARAHAQNLVTIDASAAAPAPQPVEAKPGTSRNPRGQVIGVNSQYLTLDGQPWLPVMGEFHFSRYPEAEWEQEILKMKAAGVQIISTYIIWIHHEQVEGVFDWSGQRDLRHFVELCDKHGMYVYPRIGPWAHAETRNGGFPDWVLNNSPIRQNNPIYLEEVQSFYAQIGKQLNGLLWKDGGPVIGIQIENEYHDKDLAKADDHIRTLKRMAIADGLDVPLYTVTGWDGAAIPLDAVLPVYGGYPDAPWDGSPNKLPASDVYAFRFRNRSQGTMGAIGGSGQSNASTYRGTPFLTAEVGAGIEDTYFRRPVVDADDIAAIAPVMLGSGANLLGYYMFHGGRNPDGGAITLQESQRTGYPTDVPVKSYDFQAPIGEFGQQRESLLKLKLVHYFLNDFDSLLAPMSAHAPDKVPASPTDLSIPRVAARTVGDRGFLFLNNYVRGAQMPSRPGFQVELKLPSGTVRIPDAPIDLPSGAYGIWPVNLELPGAALRYSTAQLFKRVQVGDQTYYFFFAIPGIPSEFALDATTKVEVLSGSVTRTDNPAGVKLTVGSNAEAEIQIAEHVHLVLMPRAQAEQIWRGDDPSLLLKTQAAAFSDGDRWTLESDGNPNFTFAIFGETNPISERSKLTPGRPSRLFTSYTANVPTLDLKPRETPIQPANERPPWQFGPKLDWRPVGTPLAPDDSDFKTAASWRLNLPAIPDTPSVADVLLQIDYQGDIARLYRGTTLVDDNFWNGLPWTIGLREIGLTAPEDLQLRILPLPRSFPLYIEKSNQLRFDKSGLAGALTAVHLVPRYRLTITLPGRP